MHDLTFYLVEYIVLLLGVVSIHKYVYGRGRKYDKGSLYLGVLAATYIWVFTACIQLFGIEAGLVGGIVAGGIAVVALDAAVGFLHNMGY